MKNVKPRLVLTSAALAVAFMLAFTDSPVMAQAGGTITTPTVPSELPVEIETELAPGSLKQAPLWKELIQLLEHPYGPDNRPGTADDGTVVRRPGFGAVMPPLNVYPLTYLPHTGQPLRLRTSDGEVCFDQPGPLFDPDEVVPVDANNVPLQLRTIIGSLVVDNQNRLVVSNPAGDPRIPRNGTIVARPGVNAAGRAIAVGGGAIRSFDTPINEVDFLRPATDVRGVRRTSPLRPYIGRPAAEVLGKALFWDMQVGSDGVQACGSCHFHAGVDNRTRNQLNPNHVGSNATSLTLEVQPANTDVIPADFPFHRLVDPAEVGEPLLNPGNVAGDADDVMSSMGVRFRQFVDIPPIGAASFGPAVNGVTPLLPDIGNAVADPLAVFQDLRRVEPRNTPTMHAAAFNHDNFWDGRARFNFNGGSVFGPSDPQFHIFTGTTATLRGATNRDARPSMPRRDPMAAQPVRIKFSSLASQSAGPPLSNFEMSFDGRNWPKIGKKLLQAGVTPLANQLVAVDDSVLGPFSNQGGAIAVALGRPTVVGKPGLAFTYPELIQLAFARQYWQNTRRHLNGAAGADPFDGYVLTLATGPAAAADTNQFTQTEANFSLFFGLAVQMYEQLLIPDDTPFDRFMDANPLAANGIGQPGEQNVLFPTLVPGLVGALTLVPGFGEEELFGFDIFHGANLTAALPVGAARNPAGFGSNPFTRNSRCMLCHLGPEQTDHSVTKTHGVLLSNTEFEFPTPPFVPDPSIPPAFPDGLLPAPEPTGSFKVLAGHALADEVNEAAQDIVEMEPMDMALVDNPATPWDDRIIAAPSAFGLGDQGIYNVALRPLTDDIGRGGDDPFGWPLSMSNLALKNLAGPAFNPPTDPADPLATLANFDPALGPGGGLFEETGDGRIFPGSGGHTLQSINPGLDMDPANPLMPPYMAPWLSNLAGGELHPEIDELAVAPNTITEPLSGPLVELAEILFGADLHCSDYNPALYGAGAPNFGWGPRAPNAQSGVSNNFDPPLHGSWPFANRIRSKGAFKVPQLRNVELTGPYFHTGSYLTLRQVVDFYLRGGDFPVTDAQSRDQNMVDVGLQAFGFGTTLTDLNPTRPGPIPGAQFGDGLPDPAFQYDVMPDTAHPTTPEPATTTPEAAAQALVSYLLALTDDRVRFDRAPFDHPEIFVPVDGTAPDNTGGRAALVGNPLFRQVPEVGAGGNAVPAANFLGISSTPVAGPNNDHFDR